VVSELRGKRAVVMGLGSFGGGEGAARFLAEEGAEVIVTDLRTEGELADAVQRLKVAESIRFHLGGHREEDFHNADIVIVNPAVTDDNPLLDVAREAGASLTTEMNLFFERCPATIVGVTGTNGKSTTVMLLFHILQELGLDVHLGGNIGGSLLPQLKRLSTENVVVLELSSFQLERLRWIERSPQVATVLNLSPNHLDRHGSMTEYAEAKAAILDYQHRDDVAVLNTADNYYDFFKERVRGRLALFGKDSGTEGAEVFGGFADGNLVVRVNEAVKREFSFDFARLGFTRLGESWAVARARCAHNALNLSAAVVTAVATLKKCSRSLSEEELRKALGRVAEKFHPLRHRLERVAEINGVVFVNDSIATNPESVVAALDCYPSKKVILIAGGYDKGLDYTPLVGVMVDKVKKLILIRSEGGEKLAEALMSSGEDVPLLFVDGMDDAVREAVSVAERGDVVLLSPACASYGMFRNFEERGESFREAVQKLLAQTEHKG